MTTHDDNDLRRIAIEALSNSGAAEGDGIEVVTFAAAIAATLRQQLDTIADPAVASAAISVALHQLNAPAAHTVSAAALIRALPEGDVDAVVDFAETLRQRITRPGRGEAEVVRELLTRHAQATIIRTGADDPDMAIAQDVFRDQDELTGAWTGTEAELAIVTSWAAKTLGLGF